MYTKTKLFQVRRPCDHVIDGTAHVLQCVYVRREAAVRAQVRSESCVLMGGVVPLCVYVRGAFVCLGEEWSYYLGH